jgi:hypothetical protein
MYRLNQTESADLLQFCYDECFRGITLFFQILISKWLQTFFI